LGHEHLRNPQSTIRNPQPIGHPAMDQGAPSKIQDKTAAAVCERARLGEEARGLLGEGMTPRPYLDLLIERGLHTDAVRFLAYALPKREAVWWACLCAAEVLGPEPPAAAAAALEAARAWVIDPRDEKRRAAFPAAEAADVGTPAGCAAAAAYFSGGSLAPPNLPVVAPPDHVTSDLAASSLTLSAVIKEPEKAAAKYAAFLRTGLEVASGQHAWPEATPQTTETERKPGDKMTERERRIAEMQARRARQ
jgi:hypothetical protein